MSQPSTALVDADDVDRRVRAITGGDLLEASRLITLVENDREAAGPVVRGLYPSCGQAHLVGVTGPPGAGKSTLVAALTQELRERGLTVGVIAVDPSSPFTGGAVLGDRDRMADLTLDKGVFVRSLAARGAGGGLAAAVNDSVDVMDAMGKDVVLIETVGVGQGELDVANLAHTVVLVLVPGYGDSLQAMKAGILEVADVIVVNKSDSPGAEGSAQELANEGYRRGGDADAPVWDVPVVLTSARRAEGIDRLADALTAHREHAQATGGIAASQRRRRATQLVDLVGERLRAEAQRALAGTPLMERLVAQLDAGDIDPDGAADQVIAELGLRRTGG